MSSAVTQVEKPRNIPDRTARCTAHLQSGAFRLPNGFVATGASDWTTAALKGGHIRLHLLQAGSDERENRNYERAHGH
jgi:hypothetical protein